MADCAMLNIFFCSPRVVRLMYVDCGCDDDFVFGDLLNPGRSRFYSLGLPATSADHSWYREADRRHYPNRAWPGGQTRASHSPGLIASVAHMLAGDGMKSITPLVLLGFLIVSYLNRPGSRAFPVISKLLCRERCSFYPPKPGAAAPNHELTPLPISLQAGHSAHTAVH